MAQTEVISKEDAKDRIAVRLGFRRGDRGTHSSRTMMFSDLALLLDALDATATKEEARRCVIDDNLLAKKTSATRRATVQVLAAYFGRPSDKAIAAAQVPRRRRPGQAGDRPALPATNQVLRSSMHWLSSLRKGPDKQRYRSAHKKSYTLAEGTPSSAMIMPWRFFE